MGAEKIKEIPLFKRYQIIHNAYVDVYGLLAALPQWFNDMHYFFLERGLSEKDTGVGYELRSDWYARRDASEYCRNVLEITFYARDLRKVVLENGDETFYGRVWIFVDATLVKNYRNTFGPSGWQEVLRQMYERYIKLEEIDGYLGKLYGETTDLINTIKTHLK